MSITTIRPNSSGGGSGNVSVVGAGGNYITALSDNSDATYVKGLFDKAQVRPIFDTVTVTGIGSGTQRVKSCQIRVRNARDSAAALFQTVGFQLLNENDTSLSAAGAFYSQRGTTTVTTSSGPVAFSAPGGVAWDQTQVNQLIMYATWHKDSADNGVFQRVHELYIDVDVNNQPTITGAPIVTNFTNNGRPNVSWVYADLDNDPQAAWNVKIFTSAAVAAGNFSPDNSPSTWDSGIQTGPDATVQVAIPLQNGTSYVAYVRAAQSWPGPQGQYWWSSWVASAPFTVTFIQPYTPTINSVTNVTDANSLRALIDVDVAINLLSADNASLETTIGQWISDVNCTVARITTDGLDGTSCLRVQSVASGNMSARATWDGFLEVVDVGRTYTFLASFKAVTTGRQCKVGVYWLDYTFTQIGGINLGTAITDTTGGWTQASFQVVAPPGAAFAEIAVQVLATGGALEQHKVDEMSISQGTSTSWTPGGYSNNLGDLRLERGERIDPTRGTAENWAHPQVASGGALFQTHDAGFEWTNNVERMGWAWLDKVIPDTGYIPGGMVKWLPMTTGVTGLKFGSTTTYPGASVSPQIDYLFPVVANQVHVFSVWAWVDTGTLTLTAKIEWLDQSQSVTSTSTGGDFVLTTTPQRITISATAPAGAIYASGRTDNKNGDNTKHIFFTRVGWGLGTVPVDGKFPRGGPITFKRVRFTYLGPQGQQFNGFPTAWNYGQHAKFADFDVTPGRPVIYRAWIAYTNSQGVQVVSNYSTYLTSLIPAPPVTLLRSVTDATLHVAVNRRKEASFGYVEDAQVFHPLGADAAPIKVRDWIGGEDGQLICLTQTEAQFARLRKLINTNAVLCIQWAQGGHTYALVTDSSIDETVSADIDWCDADGNQSWLKYDVTTLTYIETAAP